MMTTPRAAAVECALRCLEQRSCGTHALPLSEIHRIYADEFSLGTDGRKLLSQALEHSAAQQDRRAA